MLTKDEAQARVAKGAAILDQARPGWWNRIDVGTLTLSDPCHCIVGQLARVRNDFDAYEAEWEELFGEEGGEEEGVYATQENYPKLQDVWIEAIADRRLSQGQATALSIDALDPVVRQPISVSTRVTHSS